MADVLLVDTRKKKKKRSALDVSESNEREDEPPRPKKKKRAQAVEAAASEQTVLGQPYTDASTFISSLGGNVLSGNEQDAISVVQNFDSTQIENALKHLQQASGSEAPRPPSATPIAIPVARAHPSRPQEAPRRARLFAKLIRPGSYADAPPPVDQQPLPSTAIRNAEGTASSSQAASSQTTQHHRSMLTEKWLSTSQLNELAKTQGLVYKKGKFSRIEDQQLEFAIEEFRKKNSLNDEDIEKIIFTEDRNKGDKDKSMEFWTSVTAALQQRPIIAVYHHLKRIRNPMRQGEGGTGAWTPAQDMALRQAVQAHGQSWEKVSKAVLRSSGDCRDRYRNHLSDAERNRTTGKWSKAEEDELIRIVQEMKDKLGYEDGNEIFWGKVSEKMGGRRGRQQCQGKWNDQLRRRVESSHGEPAQWSLSDDQILVGKVDSVDVRDDSEIDWSRFPDKEWTFSPHMIQRKWRTMKTGIVGWEDMTHAEIVESLRSAYEVHASKPAWQRSRSTNAFKSAELVEDDDDVEPSSQVDESPQTVTPMDTIDPTPTPTETVSKRKKKKRDTARSADPVDTPAVESSSVIDHDANPQKKNKAKPVDSVAPSPTADDAPRKSKKKRKHHDVAAVGA